MNTSNQDSLYIIGGFAVLICLAVVCWLAWYIWYSISQKKRIAHPHLFENDDRIRLRENERKIEELRKQLADANRQIDDANRQIDDEAHNKQLLEDKIREYEEMNAQIMQNEVNVQSAMTDIAGCQLCNELHTLARNTQIAQDDQLLALLNMVDEKNPNFTKYFRTNIPEISIQDLYICVMLKLGFGPTEIAGLIGRSPTAITKVRKKLFAKLTGEAGKADEFDKLIKEL